MTFIFVVGWIVVIKHGPYSTRSYGRVINNLVLYRWTLFPYILHINMIKAVHLGQHVHVRNILKSNIPSGYLKTYLKKLAM